MSKKSISIYSELTPYLIVTALLLTLLGGQNYLKHSERLERQQAADLERSKSSKVKTVLVQTAQPADVKIDKPPKKGKMERLSSAVGKIISTDKKGHGIKWHYPEKGQPENWADLTGAYASCKNGKAQSPITLSSINMTSGFEPLFYYQATGGEVTNNGHTIKVTVKPGSYLQVMGKKYHLKQFHFHTQAEHKIDNLQYPMSAHLVHESDQGHIVVVAIMFLPTTTEYNMLVDRLPIPQTKGLTLAVNSDSMDLDPALMLPPRHSRSYFAYDGSFTTPPCTENVGWIVMKTPVYTSKKRINRFATVMGSNNRAIQPSNRRHILFSH